MRHAITPEPSEKPLFWVSSSKRDLLAMPGPVVRELGTALGVAQYGCQASDCQALKGEGPGVFEVVEPLRWRYFSCGVHGASAESGVRPALLSKKSPSGIRTAQTDVDLISARLRLARADYEVGMAKRTAKCGFIEASSGNVFTDLGLPDAELDTKLRLAVELNRLLKVRLSPSYEQRRGSGSVSLRSVLKHYKLEGFSVERLMGVSYGNGP